MARQQRSRSLVDDERDGASAAVTRHREPRGDDGAWYPELAETLYRMVYWVELDAREFEAELERLERKYQGSVYSQLIYLLSRQRLDTAAARQCWREISEHRAALAERMGSTVDLRVALVSYFVGQSRVQRNQRIIELKLFEQNRAMAYRDELTGLYNQRFFEEYLAQEVPRSDRYNCPLSLAMIGVDGFRRYSDRHGHDAGSEALTAIARLLDASLRKIDISARHGAEEFALILPATPKTGAQLVAERVRAAVEQHGFGGPQGARQLTISLGVATYPADAADDGGLVRHADRALYLAQQGGHNQVRLYGESRRSFRRARAAVDGRFRLPGTDSHPLTTVDVGDGGLLFLTDRRLPAGTLVDVTLDLGGESVTVAGRVLQVDTREEGLFQTSVRFLDLPARDQRALASFIRQANAGREEEEPQADAP